MEDDKVEQTETVALSDKNKDPDRELARVKRALKNQQAERDNAKAELDALRAQIASDKLSEQERERKELEAAKARAAEFERAANERAAENERLKLVNRLISKHKLADEEYADIVLKKYDPTEHDDFDAFVNDFAAEPKYKVFFAQAHTSEPVVAPGIPGSGSARVNTKKQTEEDAIKAFAMLEYPNDPARRESLIRNMRALDGEA